MKPRILFAGPMLGTHSGWVPAPAEELASRLARRGYSCFLTSRTLNRYARLADLLGTIWRSRHSYDILCLQVYGGPSFVVEDAASLLAFYLKKPIVMVFHGGAMPDFIAHYPDWAKRVLRRAVCLVTPSAFLAKPIEMLGFSVSVIPNAIDAEEYPYSYCPAYPPRLLWMRTFHEIYNPEMAVRVLHDVQKEIPGVTLTMAGQEKGLLERTKVLAASLGLGDTVRFAGFLDFASKRREFASHQIFLNTNRVDNMPVSVIEAAAFGLPVVATAVGGVPYLIENGVNGLLVPDDDIDGMSQAVVQLARDAVLARSISINARDWSMQLDWHRVLSSWEQLFLKVA